MPGNVTLSTAASNSWRDSTIPARGPRSVLCVVVVTTWQCGTGEGWTPPATRPAKCAMSTMYFCFDFVGDLAHAREIDYARISAASTYDQLGPLAFGNLLQLVVIDRFRVFADSIRNNL